MTSTRWAPGCSSRTAHELLDPARPQRRDHDGHGDAVVGGASEPFDPRRGVRAHGDLVVGREARAEHVDEVVAGPDDGDERVHAAITRTSIVRVVTGVASIPPIGHREAMSITAEENVRFASLIESLTPDEWARQTDCTRWDVRAMVIHCIGSADGQASVREFVHQLRAGRKVFAEIGGDHWVDGLNEVQIRDRASLRTEDLAATWNASSARALKARRRMPAPVRALPLLPLGPPVGRKPLGYLFDMGFTRDVWAHRIDIAQAIGRPMHVTPQHDGRIVADIVAEWAKLHGEPFTLHLTGDAGGTYTSGTGAEHHELDALEFVRILAGRSTGDGVLRHVLPL